MILRDTYIVCNSSIITLFKSIKHFKLDLGRALINNAQQFNPSDVIVQKHYMLHSEIINMAGHIGSLTIYTNRTCKNNEFIVYNMSNKLEYIMNENTDLYENINNSIDLFFDKFEIKKDINTDAEIVAEISEIPEYVKPEKKLGEMTMEERIAFARNR